MDVLVVHRLRVDVAAPLPAVARIKRRIDRRVLAGLDLCVRQSLLRLREGNDDAAEVAAGQSTANSPPGLAAVGGLVQTALRSAVNQRPRVAAGLMRAGQHHPGVVWIDPRA